MRPPAKYKEGPPHEVTASICGPYMAAVDRVARSLNTTRGVVIRSMIHYFFKMNPTYAEDIEKGRSSLTAAKVVADFIDARACIICGGTEELSDKNALAGTVCGVCKRRQEEDEPPL